MKPKYIKTWDELKEVESSTHSLEVNLRFGTGWISPKDDKETNSMEGHHYLSTHTFYGSQFEASTKLLQSCGFNVELANWDELGY